MGNSASTATSLLLSIVLARRLNSPTFEGINLALVAGSLVANAGGGIDAATTRTLARRPAEEWRTLLGMAVTCRAVLGIMLLPIGSAAVLWAGAGDHVAVSAAVLLVCTQALGIGVAQVSIIKPVALGYAGAYALYQLAYIAPLLLLALLFVRSAGGIWWLIAPGPIVVLLLIRRGTLPPPHRPSRAFLNLSGYLVASSFLFALYDRVDLVVAAQRFEDDLGAAYAVANRTAGFYVLVTSTLMTVLVPIVSRVDPPLRLRTIARGTIVEIGLACGVIGLGATILPTIIPEVFGGSYSDAGGLASIMAVRYALFAIYTPVAILLPLLGKPRYYLEMTVLQAAAVAAGVSLASGPSALALAPAVAPAVGLLYAILRLRRWNEHPV